MAVLYEMAAGWVRYRGGGYTGDGYTKEGVVSKSGCEWEGMVSKIKSTHPRVSDGRSHCVQSLPSRLASRLPRKLHGAVTRCGYRQMAARCDYTVRLQKGGYKVAARCGRRKVVTRWLHGGCTVWSQKGGYTIRARAYLGGGQQQKGSYTRREK